MYYGYLTGGKISVKEKTSATNYDTGFYTHTYVTQTLT